MPSKNRSKRKAPITRRSYRWRTGTLRGKACRVVEVIDASVKGKEKMRVQFQDGTEVEVEGFGNLTRTRKHLKGNLKNLAHLGWAVQRENLGDLIEFAERQTQLSEKHQYRARAELQGILEDYYILSDRILGCVRKHKNALHDCFPIQEMSESLNHVAYLLQRTLPGCACLHCAEKGGVFTDCICNGKGWLTLGELADFAYGVLEQARQERICLRQKNEAEAP